MNRAELIDNVTQRLQTTKGDATKAVDTVFDVIQRAVAQGEKVAITGFGVFERIERGPRMVRNPRTGERTRAKKTAVPKFRAGTNFKDVVSGARKLAKVADAATKAAAGSVRKSAAATAKSAAEAPSKAANAAQRAAKAAQRPGKKTTAKKTTAKKSPAKTSTAKKSAAKKSTAKKSAAKR